MIALVRPQQRRRRHLTQLRLGERRHRHRHSTAKATATEIAATQPHATSPALQMNAVNLLPVPLRLSSASIVALLSPAASVSLPRHRHRLSSAIAGQALKAYDAPLSPLASNTTWISSCRWGHFVSCSRITFCKSSWVFILPLLSATRKTPSALMLGSPSSFSQITASAAIQIGLVLILRRP
jgi:hypothetical protein